MEEPETTERLPTNPLDGGRDASAAALATLPAPSPPPRVGPAQADPAPCPTCGTTAASASPSYVYVIGRVEARFPRPGVEKEFAQATGRAETAGRTDQQAFHEVLSKRENRYLARQLCWVLTVQGLETYILVPRDPADLDLLVEAIHPSRVPWITTVIGVRGPIAPPELCNGLMVPIVMFEQIYTFTHDAFVKAIPKPENISAEQFQPAAQELFSCRWLTMPARPMSIAR